MPISDGNPERRNLIVASLGIVAFYLGEAHLVKSALKLPLINIEFEHLEAIIIIFWAMYIWFIFRYWQINDERLWVGISKESRDYKLEIILRWYVAFKTKLRFNVDAGFIITDLHAKRSGWEISVDTLTRGMGNNLQPKDRIPVKFNGFLARIVKLYIFLKMAVQKPTISSYFFPYVFFWFASWLAIYKEVVRH